MLKSYATLKRVVKTEGTHGEWSIDARLASTVLCIVTVVMTVSPRHRPSSRGPPPRFLLRRKGVMSDLPAVWRVSRCL